MSDDLLTYLNDCYAFNGDPAIKKAIDRIEEQTQNMTEAMNHCVKHWKENGAKDDDQLGVVALILAHGLGLTAALGEKKDD